MDRKANAPRLVAKVRRPNEADSAAVARVRALFARPEMSVEALKKRAEIARKWEAEHGPFSVYAGARR